MGYEELNVSKARMGNSWPHLSNEKGASTRFGLILDRCPFYPEGGGQARDRGHLVVVFADRSERAHVFVENTTKVNDRAIALQCSLPEDMAYKDVSALLFHAFGSEPTAECTWTASSVAVVLYTTQRRTDCNVY